MPKEWLKEVLESWELDKIWRFTSEGGNVMIVKSGKNFLTGTELIEFTISPIVIGEFKKITFPTIKKVFPGSIADDIEAAPSHKDKK